MREVNGMNLKIVKNRQYHASSNKLFVSVSSNMMKLGKTWKIRLVIPAQPAFRRQVYKVIGGL